MKKDPGFCPGLYTIILSLLSVQYYALFSISAAHCPMLARGYAVVNIFPLRTPTQVVNLVVLRVLVYMMHNREVIRVRDKRLRNKPMDIVQSAGSVFSQAYRPVSPCHRPALEIPVAFTRVNSALGIYGIEPLISRNVGNPYHDLTLS